MTTAPGHYIAVCRDCHLIFPVGTRRCPMCEQLTETKWSERVEPPTHLLAWVLFAGVLLGSLLVVLVLHNTN